MIIKEIKEICKQESLSVIDFINFPDGNSFLSWFSRQSSAMYLNTLKPIAQRNISCI